MHKIMQEDSWLIGSLVAIFPSKNCPEKRKTIHAFDLQHMIETVIVMIIINKD
jgi:hypothetical protein